MILVDTSVWIDHLHKSEPALVDALASDDVACHPLVIEELGLGSMRNRGNVLGLLADLGQFPVLAHSEIRTLVDANRLWGKGLGVVDVHLLGSVMLAPGGRLWTRDKRMRSAAKGLGIPTVRS